MSDAHDRDRAGNEKQRSRGYACMVRPMDAVVDPVGDQQKKASCDRERSKASRNSQSQALRARDLRPAHGRNPNGCIRGAG